MALYRQIPVISIVFFLYIADCQVRLFDKLSKSPKFKLIAGNLLPVFLNQSEVSCRNQELDPNQYRMLGCTTQKAPVVLFLEAVKCPKIQNICTEG